MTPTGKKKFQSTPSAREGDIISSSIYTPITRFNPRLPRGKATCGGQQWQHWERRFNPRLPRGKATRPVSPNSSVCMFQSTPSAREGDKVHEGWGDARPQFQSTPSAREGDMFRVLATGRERVSIHAFREGRRLIVHTHLTIVGVFQSTPSAREGDGKTRLDCFECVCVSIHAFREGRRLLPSKIVADVACFNPRLPRGKATTPPEPRDDYETVSIHAFREGRRRGVRGAVVVFDVSIHAFREGRRQKLPAEPYRARVFQSTPSAREGDCYEFGH